ncbi:cytochrome c biogenesis protein [Limisalsivibrio acetivorans]|uniref:cytochrome c biogenesis protein n=1 Tax=Limisalsivibrio acetivorans TaxID=1304888 RepID=UPI0003B41BC2|nr:cytochrome c biogenesis protein CcsA [Limisalsivibrio acetivorans]
MNKDRILDIAAVIAILGALYMAFIFAPEERVMGAVQKIFYFHVASAWLSFFAFFVTFICSIAFLVKDSFTFDDVAASSAEIGLLFCTIVLITGPIWARPAWGVWWTWDPRLTTTTILWFIYMGYLMLRKFIDEPGKRARFAAAVGIIGFLDVPVVYFSIRMWRTIHPNVMQKGGGGLHPDMLKALIFSVIAFTILYFALLSKRTALAVMERRIDALKMSGE